jgi:hypothetical protein
MYPNEEIPEELLLLGESVKRVKDAYYSRNNPCFWIWEIRRGPYYVSVKWWVWDTGYSNYNCSAQVYGKELIEPKSFDNLHQALIRVNDALAEWFEEKTQVETIFDDIRGFGPRGVPIKFAERNRFMNPTSIKHIRDLVGPALARSLRVGPDERHSLYAEELRVAMDEFEELVRPKVTDTTWSLIDIKWKKQAEAPQVKDLVFCKMAGGGVCLCPAWGLEPHHEWMSLSDGLAILSRY